MRSGLEVQSFAGMIIFFVRFGRKTDKIWGNFFAKFGFARFGFTKFRMTKVWFAVFWFAMFG